MSAAKIKAKIRPVIRNKASKQSRPCTGASFDKSGLADLRLYRCPDPDSTFIRPDLNRAYADIEYQPLHSDARNHGQGFPDWLHEVKHDGFRVAAPRGSALIFSDPSLIWNVNTVEDALNGLRVEPRKVKFCCPTSAICR